MITTNQRAIYVGLGEMAVTKDPEAILTCSGLGSCISLSIWDPVVKIGGMAHMLLPKYKNKYDISSPPSKYVDSATPLLVSKMEKQGSVRANLIIKIAGGARMLSIPGEDNRLDIGAKNIDEIKATLQREKLPVCGSDLGGGYGRTVQLFLESGKTIVRSVTGKIIEL
jgi:chemotaxis protein CheD